MLTNKKKTKQTNQFKFNLNRQNVHKLKLILWLEKHVQNTMQFKFRCDYVHVLVNSTGVHIHYEIHYEIDKLIFIIEIMLKSCISHRIYVGTEHTM